MTIAAGFVCADGIVLCADTLFTFTSAKRYAAKLWCIPPGNDAVVALAGAGEDVMILRARDSISAALSPTMTHDEIVEMIDYVVSDLNRKYVEATNRDDALQLQLLVAIRTPDRCRLYVHWGTVLGPVDDSQCIGLGSGLGLYFTGWLFKRGMPMKWAKTIAAHLLQQTKKYVPDCGGDSHILGLPASGPAEYVNLTDVAELETHLAGITEAMRSVLVYAPDASLSEATLTHRIAVLDAAVRAARKTVIDPVTRQESQRETDLEE